MATYVSPTDSRGYYTSLVINEVSRDITNNTTFIYYEYRLHSGPHNYFQSFGSTINLTIDGVTLLNTTTQSVSFQSPFYNTSVLLANGNRTISHNADGTRSISFSSSFRTNSTTTFTPIPTHTISGSQALTTIPRASTPTLNVSTQVMGGAITVFTNRASASFTHTIKYVFGNQSGTIATGVMDDTSWTLPNTLANAIPNGTSGSGTITCETYNGSTLIGTRTVAFTATVPNNATFQPNASISSITEGQSGLGAFTVFIQNKSRLRVQSTGSGKFSTTISQYRVTIDGVNYTGADITSALINKSGTIVVTLRVTDSRGHFTEVTQNVTLVAYFAPKINAFSASRSPNDQGTNLSAPINFEIAPVNNQNSRYYRVRYRVSGGTWVDLVASNSYYSHITTHTGSSILNVNNSYEVELFVQDSFTSATHIVTVGTAFDLLNFRSTGKGIAIGKVSESDTFEVALPTNFSETPKVNGTPIGATLHKNDAGAWTPSGFYEVSSPSNFYSGANSWQHLIEARHSNTTNNYAMQIAGSFFDQNFWVRKTNNSASTPWSQLWHTGNFNPNNYIPATPSSSSWGSYNISATKGGYSGFHFTNGGNTFMVRDSDGLSGVMKPSGWAWYFDTNGALIQGSVPWSLITGQPSVVHSSGSNANGRWLRFTNGIQICWHLDGTGIATSNATTPVRWNAKVFTFPAAFTATPSISPAIFRSTGSMAWSGVQEESATGCALYILSPYNTTGFIRYIAIGTW